MKKFVLLLAMTIATSAISLAQLTEGHVTFDIEMSSDNPEMAMIVDLMQGSTVDVYFADGIACSVINVGDTPSSTTVFDENSDQVLVIAGKKALLTTQKEMNSHREEAADHTLHFTKTKKDILGYTCKKVIFSDEDGNEMDYWYTEEIYALPTDKNTVFARIPGFVMEYSAILDGMTTSFIATHVETSLDSDVISSKLSMEIPEECEEVTYEEFYSIEEM